MTAFQLGPWLIEPSLNRARLNGDVAQLEPKVMQVLVRLAETPGEVVKKEDLIRSVWADTFVTDDVLTRSISELRKAFGDDPRTPRYIETIPRSGYRLLIPALPQVREQSPKPNGNGSAATVPIRTVQTEKTRRHFPRAAVLAGATLVAIAVSFLWWQWPEPAPVVKNYKQITYDGQRKGDGLATDGPRVYFPAKTPGGYGIAQVSSNGGAAVLLPTSLGSDLRLLDLSPDGSELLVRPSSEEDREEQLYAISVPDGAPRRIGDITASSAGWSPNGQFIVYVHGHGLFSASRIGADVRKLADLPGWAYQPRISPDGSTVRFVLFGEAPSLAKLWDINIDGTGLRQVLPNWNYAQTEGNWTRDGRYFLFQAWMNGSMGIWALPRRATLLSPHPAPIRLTPDTANVVLPVPSPDGKNLFVSVGVTRLEVMRFQAESTKFEPYLPISGSQFNFTRDGQHVIYMRLPGFELVRSRIDGSEQVKLLRDSSLQLVRGGRLSPDEKQIAIVELTNEHGIYLLPAEGGKPELLLPGGDYDNPDWSPDGNSLVFADMSREPHSLAVIDVRTKKVSVVPGSAGMWLARWSPNGRYLAAVRSRDEVIMLFDFERQQWSKVADGKSSFPAWSPDGKYLYFISVQGTANTIISEQSLYRYEVSSGKQELVSSLRDLRHDALNHFISWIGFATDGSLLALRDNTTVDIYSLDWISP